MTMSMGPHDGTGVSKGTTSNEVLSNERSLMEARWKEKSEASIVSAEEFLTLKTKENLYVVGVTGFSGQWSEEKISTDPRIKSDVESATLALRSHLSALKDQFGDKLVVSSGATMEGVPKFIYELCSELQISAMGVTSEKAFDYPLGKMLFLIVDGRDWGEESPTFLKTSDELILVGGGGQAKREAIAASTEQKKLTVFKGYGGSADALNAEDLPGANFLGRY